MKPASRLSALALAAALASVAWPALAATPAPSSASAAQPAASAPAPATAPAAAQANPEDWIVYDDVTYTPVLDDVSRALQQARQALDQHKPKQAAQAMREASQALAREAASASRADRQRAAADDRLATQTRQRMDALTRKLNATADGIAAGRIQNTAALDKTLDKAARADLESRWRVTDTTTWLPVADAPQHHLATAMDAYLHKDLHAAATEVRKADGYLRLEGARATGAARHAVDAAHADLVKTALALDHGAVKSEQALRASFARADHALALAQRERAAADWSHRAYADAGLGLSAAGRNLEAAAHWAGGETGKAAGATADEVRTLGDKLAAGGHWVRDEVAGGFDHLGHALDRLGHAIHAPGQATAVRLPATPANH